MNGRLSHSAEGVTRLVVEKMTGDAFLRGLPDATEVEAGGAYRGEFALEDDVLRLEGQVERLTVPQGLAVTIEVAHGNLRVQAMAAPVEAGEVDGDVRLDHLSAPIVIEEAGGDARCDAVADVTFRHGCRGDVRFSNGGTLTCGEVGGDLRINDAGGLDVDELSGDLWAERVAGPLTARTLGGDARLSEVAGLVTFEQLAGDLRGAALVGGLAANEVHGDVTVHGPFVGDTPYTLTADGDVSLHLTAADEPRLTVRAAGRIRADVPLNPTGDGTPTYTATIGSGVTPVTAIARGDLRIARAGGSQAGGTWERKRGPDRDAFSDLSGLGERIREQVAASLASAGINIETGDVNLGRGKWPRGEKWGRASHPPPPPPPPVPPKPPKPAASANSEEMLTILRLVEEGKITPEEADKLLRALGG